MSKRGQRLHSIKAFIKQWSGKRGEEKGETQKFWISLLHYLFNIDDSSQFIEFEIPVKTLTKEKGDNYIDAYIHPSKVLIEQKSSYKNLNEKFKQSDGSILTPYQQARRYAEGLPFSQKPKWIIICNFSTFHIHDMEHPNDAPQIVNLEDLEKEYYRLDFLIKPESNHIQKEEAISLQAGEIVGVLYDKLLTQYKDSSSLESQKSLNKLCVRLVFCLYAEDAGIFGTKDMFHDYMAKFSAAEFREKLIKLFRILNIKAEDRDPYEDEDLLAFPYVNGGMFEGEIEVPRITEEIRTLILERASKNFDWSQISPTIFGAVFESTLNSQTRRSGGMHYTSIRNIHRVIDPLFLNELKAELASIKSLHKSKKKVERAEAFQKKLSNLKFLDPACGSGNFLTESFTSLRRLENEAIRIVSEANMVFGYSGVNNPIRVNISQFYGIEVNDFACSVAQTALWIAEIQMMQETEDIVGFDIEPLPLKSYINIKEGNALKLDWNLWEYNVDNNTKIIARHANIYPTSEEDLSLIKEPEKKYDTIDVYSSNIEIRNNPKVAKTYRVKFDYIMGNPPFGGARIMSASQKADLLSVFGKDWKNIGNLDYVTGWYKKAAEIMLSDKESSLRCALVSTNSITQGEQVANLWKPLMKSGIHIDFAWRTFVWDSEAPERAHVHVVIIGFSATKSNAPKFIYYEDNSAKKSDAIYKEVKNINGYLIDGENIFVEGRSKPLCNVPSLLTGNQRIDNNYYIFSEAEKKEFIKKEPTSKRFFKKWYGADEFINNRPRWCLYLGLCTPAELKSMPFVFKRVQQVREYRLSSNRIQTLKAADCPHKFGLEVIPTSNFMIIPVVSSERRNYIPMGFLSPNYLCSNQVNMILNANLYHFGVLTSSVHMAWVRVIGGRLEMRYRYSKDIIYNNFPWPKPTKEQEKKIEKTAEMILKAREAYANNSFSDLYDNTIMPIELRKAHRDNDIAVLEAYGLSKNIAEDKIVAYLFKLYEKLTK